MNRSLALPTWLAWGVAASVAVLAGRNPFWQVLILCTVLGVRISFPARQANQLAWRLLIRGLLLISVLAVVFNALTARTGDRVLLTISDRIPLIDGPITLNAVIYGLLSALVILGLSLVWSTVGSQISWAELTRILPDQVTGFAVAGATAINLIPQTVTAITDIREACAARGMETSRSRGLVYLVSPIINTGLDRSMQLAEVLEARGFGGHPAQQAGDRSRWVVGWTSMLTGLLIGSYGLLAHIKWSIGFGLIATLTGIGLIWTGFDRDAVRRTRYAPIKMATLDWLVTAGALMAVLTTAFLSITQPGSLQYEPYPGLLAPLFTSWTLIPMLFLIMPALLVQFRRHTDD